MKLAQVIESDLNRLFVFRTEDGYSVEAVHYRGDTLCVSTQVGCPVRCLFCASGKEGLLRNLSEEEILSQVESVKKILPVSRVAFAGIGDPLANWREVKGSFLKLREMGIKASFYTTGFPLENLRELLHLPHNGVSVSIHSLNPDTRKHLMPFSGPLEKLVKFLKEELPRLSKRKRKKVSLAYLILKGVNDSDRDLEALSRLALDLDVGVTLLYYNKVGPFEPPSEEEYERAFLFLKGKGIRVTLSTRFRKDKIGGCGTLTVGKVA